MEPTGRKAAFGGDRSESPLAAQLAIVFNACPYARI